MSGEDKYQAHAKPANKSSGSTENYKNNYKIIERGERVGKVMQNARNP
jgi:hypothetical protein